MTGRKARIAFLAALLLLLAAAIFDRGNLLRDDCPLWRNGAPLCR